MSHLPDTDVPHEIASRITSAADQLYAEGGKISFPNVDTVRRRARVNMNDASAVMRIWRRTQTVSAPLQTAVPDAVQSASQAMLTTVWTVATETANANLQLAQAGWEQERTEAEACRQQLACAFDSQTEELATLQRCVDESEKRLAAQAADLRAAVAGAADLQSIAAASAAQAATAEARSKEIAQRADDLKAELAWAHSAADQQRQDFKNRLEAAESTIRELQEELRRRSAIESDMREELARLRVQAEAVSTKDYLSPAGPNEKARTSSDRPATTRSKLPNGDQRKGEAG